MNRRGFTLIELLAVIVILAIIALIAIPQILGVIETARKGAAKDSAYGYIDAVEKYMVMHDVDSAKYQHDLRDNTWDVANSTTKNEVTVPALNSIIKVKGEKPTSGTVTVNNKNEVTSATLVINNYNVVCIGNNCEVEGSSTNSGSGNTTTTEESTSGGTSTTTTEPTPVVVNGATKVEAQTGETHKGIAYLNPTNISAECNASNSTSTTETKTGCMKWYIFDDSGDNYTMILDHNTTARIKWNDSNSNVAYESSNLKAAVDDLVTTSGWEVTPRLITADEVNTIVGGVSTWNVNDSSTWFYFEGTGTNNQTQPAYDSSNRSSYDWLYNNLSTCKTDFGCTIEDENMYNGYGTATGGKTWGYRTSTPVGTAGSGSSVWYVHASGSLSYSDANIPGFGVRPVISVSKSLID